MKIKIGTRKSRLARIQTDLVVQSLSAADPTLETEIIEISTQGDEELKRPLSDFMGKGVFVRALEEALINGEIDLAVHSAKDLPMEQADELKVIPVMGRAEASDMFVTKLDGEMSMLPKGTRIGTGSLRRKLQIHKFVPDVKILPIRGNVETRIKKMINDEYDAIILAAAGVARLGIQDQFGQLKYKRLDPARFIPAACQGILAAEFRKNDAELESILKHICYQNTAICFEAERAFLTELDGGCNAPCAIYCVPEHNYMNMFAMYAPDADAPRHLARRYPLDKSVSMATVMAMELKG